MKKNIIMVLMITFIITSLVGCGKDEKQKEQVKDVVVFTYDKESDKTVIVNDEATEVLSEQKFEVEKTDDILNTMTIVSRGICGTVSKEYLTELAYNTKKNEW